MSDRYTVERIMEIISFVVEEKGAGKPLAKINIDDLHKRGYTESEISAAFSWILERDTPVANDEPVESTGEGFRVLHRYESDLILPEAWGMMLSYVNLGFLTHQDVEQILERCIVMGETTIIGTSELRALIAAYVMFQQPMPVVGSKRTLTGNESIN